MQAPPLRPQQTGHPLVQRACLVIPQHEPGGYHAGGASPTPSSGFAWDVSGRRKALIPTGSGTSPTTKGVIANAGRAWLFDGVNQNLSAQHAGQHPNALNSGYTVAFAMQAIAAPSAAKFEDVFGGGGGPGSYPIFRWSSTSGTTRQAWLHRSGVQAKIAGSALSGGVTYFVTATWDKVTVKVYLDGIFSVSVADTASGYLGSPNKFCNIGAQLGTTAPFNGNVGHLVVLPWALPAQAVAALVAAMRGRHDHISPSFLKFFRQWPLRFHGHNRFTGGMQDATGGFLEG